MSITQGGQAVFLKRVRLKNYRSIAACDVSLGPLTFLVGPNGSGKSNFLDALRLITDALTRSLDHALRERGGIQEVRRRSTGHPTNFGIRIDFQIAEGAAGFYAFEIAAQTGGTYTVKREDCSIADHRYTVELGKLVRSPSAVAPPAVDDRLYLVNAAGLPAFRPLYDALSRMGFYNLNPDEIRKLQPPDKGDLLRRDGGNLASVLERMAALNGAGAKPRVEEYLAQVVPGIEGFKAERVGHMETIHFFQRVQGAARPWSFPAINMSDGTLRALGILVALFQQPEPGEMTLVGIEEPEAALHPAAAGVLLDCLREAARRTQVIVTSHSPELLDDARVDSDSLLAVLAENGTTYIGRLEQTTRDVLKEQLYTAGELLRSDELRPEPSARTVQLDLFPGEPA